MAKNLCNLTVVVTQRQYSAEQLFYVSAGTLSAPSGAGVGSLSGRDLYLNIVLEQVGLRHYANLQAMPIANPMTKNTMT